MSILLLQNTAGSVQVYIETIGGTPATSLDASDVQVDLKNATDAFFVNKALTADTNATATIGSGANGTVTVEVPGTAGNTYTVEVVVPAGTSPLTVTKAGTVVTVELAVAASVLQPLQNTASLVAAAITALGSEVQASASGTGADPLTAAEGPTSLAGGADGDFTNLGAGFYEIDLTSTDTATIGNLAIRVSGPSIRSSLVQATVATAVTPTPTPVLAVPTTVIYGYILNASGVAVANASVSARVLSIPTILHPGSDGVLLTTSVVATKTDSTGYFTLTLISGSVVDVLIPSANFRRTITVPSVSTNLFDMP